MVTMLVCHPGAFDVEFHMNAISILNFLEQLAGQGNGSSIWVLRVMNTLGSGEGTSGQLA